MRGAYRTAMRARTAMKESFVHAGLGMTLAALSIPFAVALPATAHADPAPADVATRLAGRTVFIDPGHQGTGHNENLSRQVDDGRGGTKDCQTTGMTTVNGVPEHTITWKVGQLVKTSLESLGAKVVLSRPDDTGWGGCVDERAKAANASGADVAVSIHADGGPPNGHGFHLIVPQLPIPDAEANQAQSGGGLAASKDVRDAYLKGGFTPSSYLSTDNGLQTRADIAGPALTEVPDVFVEMGNGANADDAKLLESGDGQLKHAVAITTGLVTYLLGGQPVAPARGTRPDSATTDRSTEGTSAAEPTTPRRTPRTSSPPATAQGSTPKTGTNDADTMVTSVVNLLTPLLEAAGVDPSLTDAKTVGPVTDLASALIGIAVAGAGAGIGALNGTN